MRVINKIGRPRSESPICFNNHEYDYYRPNWTTRSSVTDQSKFVNDRALFFERLPFFLQVFSK